MDAAAVARALQDVRFDARQASRHEDRAADERRRRNCPRGRAPTSSSLLPRRAPCTTRTPTTSSRPSSPRRPRPPPNGTPPYARRSGSRPAPTSSRRRASWAHWSRPSPARATKPSATSSPAAPDCAWRPTSTPGSPAPSPRTAATAPTRPPVRGPPASCRSRSSRTRAAVRARPPGPGRRGPTRRRRPGGDRRPRRAPQPCRGASRPGGEPGVNRDQEEPEVVAVWHTAAPSAGTSRSCSPTARSTRGPSRRSAIRTTLARRTPTTTPSASAPSSHARSA